MNNNPFEQFPKPANNVPEKEEDKKEREQTPEEIREILNIAIENQCEVKIAILDKNGINPKEAIVEPYEIEGKYLVLTTEDGYGLSVELSRIEKAELPLEEEKN
jgi:hypothetical protein